MEKKKLREAVNGLYYISSTEFKVGVNQKYKYSYIGRVNKILLTDFYKYIFPQFI